MNFSESNCKKCEQSFSFMSMEFYRFPAALARRAVMQRRGVETDDQLDFHNILTTLNGKQLQYLFAST